VSPKLFNINLEKYNVYYLIAFHKWPQMTTNDVKQMPKKHPEGSGFDFIFFRAQDSKIPDLQHPCLAISIA